MTPFRIRNLRWIIAGLLFLETILNYIDLQTLSVVAPVLTKELNMTGGDYARATQAFQITYMIMFLLGGWILDRVGVRWGMVLAMGWWSIAEMMHALARNPLDLAFYRFLFGFGYPGAYLAAAKAGSEWYQPSERAFITGVYTAGATVGATIAPPLVAWVTLSSGWRYAFVTPGAAGLVYLILWLLIYQPPEKHKWLTDAERSYILAGKEKKAIGEVDKPITGGSWLIILQNRYFWAVALGRMLGDNPWIFYALWVPLFLSKQHGLSLKEIGFLGWIPFLFADFGSLGGGWLSGFFIRRGWPVIRARLLVMLCAAFISIFTFSLGLVASTALIIGLLSLMMFSTMAWMVNLSTIPVDAFPKELVGRVVGITTMAAILGQLLLTLAIGYSIEHYSYRSLFILMSFAAPAAYLVIRLILRKEDLQPEAVLMT